VETAVLRGRAERTGALQPGRWGDLRRRRSSLAPARHSAWSLLLYPQSVLRSETSIIAQGAIYTNFIISPDSALPLPLRIGGGCDALPPAVATVR
jgi:hypothetical protein